MRKFLTKGHKWVGWVLAIFTILFAISGILLNHRRAFSGIDLPRTLLPESYEYSNWNNGSIVGSLALPDSSVWLYGGIGVWQTDRDATAFVSRNNGLGKGADNLSIKSLARTASDELYALSTFVLYRFEPSAQRWEEVVALPKEEKGYTDLIVQSAGDSIILLSRSYLYLSEDQGTTFQKIELKAPEGYTGKASLFRTLWLLHSGELFGTAGQIVVDIVGLLTIVLCVTGIIITISRLRAKRRRKRGERTRNTLWLGSLKYHNRIGSLFLILLLIISISGMFLRPPLMIAIIKSKVKPLPGTTLSSDNPWHDKLRKLRYDSTQGDWLLSTSEGFYTLSEISARPQPLTKTPPVSVMGLNVWEQSGTDTWIVGSFSGLFEWDRRTGTSVDIFTGRPHITQRGGMPSFDNAISGYSEDFSHGTLVFDYLRGIRYPQGSRPFPDMTEEMKPGRISLWHTALELHVGRLYEPFMGKGSLLFIFLSGLLLTFILLSGYIAYRKWHKRRK